MQSYQTAAFTTSTYHRMVGPIGLADLEPKEP